MDFIKIFLTIFVTYNIDLFAFKVFDEYKAANAYKNKNYDKAQKEYENILINDSQDLETIYNIANVFYQKKEYPKAINYYKKIADSNLEDKKKKEDVHFNYGCCAFQLNNLQDSLTQFENVLAINPDNKRAKDNIEKIKKLLEEQKKKEEKDKKQKNEKQEKENRDKESNENEQQKNDKKNDKENNSDKKDANNKSDEQKNSNDQKDDNLNQNNKSEKDSKEQQKEKKSKEINNSQNNQSQKESFDENKNGTSEQNNDDKSQSIKDKEHENEKLLGKEITAFLNELQEQEKEINKYFMSAKLKNSSKADNHGQKNW